VERNRGWRSTPRVLAIEAKHGKSLEDILRALYYEECMSYAELEVALGVPAKTVAAWMIRLDLNPQRLAQRKAAELAS
jgi:hypothetical protein